MYRSNLCWYDQLFIVRLITAISMTAMRRRRSAAASGQIIVVSDRELLATPLIRTHA